jgi:hypothetical protein
MSFSSNRNPGRQMGRGMSERLVTARAVAERFVLRLCGRRRLLPAVLCFELGETCGRGRPALLQFSPNFQVSDVVRAQQPQPDVAALYFSCQLEQFGVNAHRFPPLCRDNGPRLSVLRKGRGDSGRAAGHGA